MGRENSVADVDLTGLEPLSVRVIAHPSDDLAAQRDAGGRQKLVGPRTEPPKRFIIAASEKNGSVVGARRPNRDPAIGERPLNIHGVILTNVGYQLAEREEVLR